MKLWLLLFSGLAFAQTTSHSVTLNWIDSTNPATTTYSVYRFVGPCTGTPTFTKIASSVAVKTFVDSTVLASTTYCYAVTATNATAESAKSVPASAVLPADLVSPTGLITTVLVVTGP